MKSEDTPFEGGPMDGRVLPVLLGITGHPPKTYRIPVPAPDGGAPTVLVYRRVPRGRGTRTGLTRGGSICTTPRAGPVTAADGRGRSRRPIQTPRRGASRTTRTGDRVAPTRAHSARGPRAPA
ncbi:hypothetical protein SHKM778_16410 [Streptomyces sp. KM77-8]|uniref:Uncharacterized protein n=1 Tax=Streptomyces haneummycinicus TaxID=3074435 RepID=A0AAT9HD73_9ACTN